MYVCMYVCMYVLRIYGFPQTNVCMYVFECMNVVYMYRKYYECTYSIYCTYNNMCTVCIYALYVCANSSRLLHAEILSDILATASFVPPHMPPFITMQWFTWSRRMCTGYLESIHSSTAILYPQLLYAIIHPKVKRDINILMYVCI